MKRAFSLSLVVVLLSSLLMVGCQRKEKQVVYVYNWGEYISDGSEKTLNVNKAFEKKHDVKVVYDYYDNNEAMYAKIKGGGVRYDVIIPSDYMIERMISEGLLQKINFENLPNYKFIPEEYKNLAYDPKNEYSVPYAAGEVGLIYNKKMVEEEPTSWGVLWDSRYAKKILMINNPRDAFAIAQSYLGIDYNTKDKAEWEACAQKLKEQKPLVQAYVNDEVFNKMESGEAAMAVYFAGDYVIMLENNPDLGFVFPKEGVNTFVDAACIPANARNKDLAELYINFLLEPEIALANAEYICYASPHTEVVSNPDYAFYKNEYIYPDKEKLHLQIFENLPPETLNLLSSLWDGVKLHAGEVAKN